MLTWKKSTCSNKYLWYNKTKNQMHNIDLSENNNPDLRLIMHQKSEFTKKHQASRPAYSFPTMSWIRIHEVVSENVSKYEFFQIVTQQNLPKCDVFTGFPLVSNIDGLHSAFYTILGRSLNCFSLNVTANSSKLSLSKCLVVSRKYTFCTILILCFYVSTAPAKPNQCTDYYCQLLILGRVNIEYLHWQTKWFRINDEE